MHQGHRIQQVTQVHKSPGEETQGSDEAISGLAGILSHNKASGRADVGAGDSPADQAEPGEAVVEGVASGQGVVAVLHSTAGELCGAVVHFSHQVQPLSAGGSITHTQMF